MWHILDLIILKIKGYKTIGHIRYKNESLAPEEWKKSFWEKLINNELITPINLDSQSYKKEIKFFIKGKVVIIAINVFLISFIHLLFSQCYNIISSEIALYNIPNFQNQIDPKDIENKLKQDYIIKHSDNIKSQALPFANSLLIIYMILKHYKNKGK